MQFFKKQSDRSFFDSILGGDVMKVRFKPPTGSSLESLAGEYEVKEERLTLIVPMEGHTDHHPGVVYISAIKEHCEGVI